MSDQMQVQTIGVPNDDECTWMPSFPIAAGGSNGKGVYGALLDYGWTCMPISLQRFWAPLAFAHMHTEISIS